MPENEVGYEVIDKQEPWDGIRRRLRGFEGEPGEGEDMSHGAVPGMGTATLSTEQ